MAVVKCERDWNKSLLSEQLQNMVLMHIYQIAAHSNMTDDLSERIHRHLRQVATEAVKTSRMYNEPARINTLAKPCAKLNSSRSSAK